MLTDERNRSSRYKFVFQTSFFPKFVCTWFVVSASTRFEHKCLDILYFVLQFAYFASDQIKEEGNKTFLFFAATIEDLCHKKQLLTFLEQLLSNFLKNYGKLFWEISRNLWKALISFKAFHQHLSWHETIKITRFFARILLCTQTTTFSNLFETSRQSLSVGLSEVKGFVTDS